MAVIRWLTKSGLRVTMLIAALVFVYHASSELLLLSGSHPSFLQLLELTALDVKFRHRGPKPPDQWHVAVAAADEKAIRSLGRLPWSRAIHARLTDVLSELGAKAIAFDMTFEDTSAAPEHEPTGQLQAIAESGAVTEIKGAVERGAALGEAAADALSRSKDRTAQAWAGPLRDGAADLRSGQRTVQVIERELGRLTLLEDPDRVFARSLARSKRAVLGILAHSRVEAQAVGSEALEASLALIRTSTIGEIIAQSAEGIGRVLPDSRAAIETGLYRRFFGVQAPTPVLARATPFFGTINAFPDADGVYRRVPLVSAVKDHGLLVPTLALKAVEVAGAPERIEVIASETDPSPEAIRVGDRTFELELASTTTLDWYGPFTPDQMPIFSIADLLAGKLDPSVVRGRIVFVAATAVGTHDQRVTPFGSSVPGVSVHATLAQNLLDGRHLVRPRYVLAIELVVFLIIGLVAGLVMVRLGAVGQISIAVAMAAAWVLIDRYVLFPSGLVVYAVLPTLQIFLSLIATASWRFLVEEREKRKTRQAFSRYLAPAVMDKVLEHPEEFLRLGGRRYEATVLFSDIRGFTTISEALSPEDLGSLLNRYMTPMTDLVFASGGTLDKYIGDAVMAFWGAPLEQPDHAVRACRTALEMLKKVEEINVELERDELPRIAIGIGISSGPMTIGNMGSEDHFAYTALGDRVNLGSRLEGQTKDYGVDIILSDACYELVKDHLQCRELGALRVKGKLEPVRIFELMSEQPLSAERRSFVESFHLGLVAFRERRWEDAMECFERALELAGDRGDKSSEDYLALCEEYQAAPPPAGWDGVRIASNK
ncbi:MAG: CHASE2 domain-containing protein [Deltaproteobacteria bacterium]|nr:CHASE2 domain-containing protein [Deltaproteobacteria bacterium]